MFSGFYTITSDMMVDQEELNMMANDLTNVKTNGYRNRRLVKTTFGETFIRQMNGQNTATGGGSTITLAGAEMASHKQGEIQDTDKTHDLAIGGDGYFAIQGEDGAYLTGNGHFSTGEEGNLILPGVGMVMGGDGPVYVDKNGFNVGKDGIVYDDEGNGLGQAQIMGPDDMNALALNENDTCSMGARSNLTQVCPSVCQSRLKKSGVDLNTEMTRTMEIQKAFQSCAKALTILDRMGQKSASDIRKL